MADHEHKTGLWLKWGLAIAQGLILTFLGWFGRQQLDMHDQLNQLTWEMQQSRGNVAQVQENKRSIDRLDFRVSDLEKRQDRDEHLRDQAQRGH